jgi:hypothetical protein
MDKKPQVFPEGKNMNDAMKEANEFGTNVSEQDAKVGTPHKTAGELSAQDQMNQNTLDLLEKQMVAREEFLARKKSGESVEPIEETQTQTVQYATPIETQFEAKDARIEDEAPNLEGVYAKLSQPQKDVPYDALKLPSGGLLYKNHKSTVDVAYLNATDEDIITNPNLLQSGKFLEVLINRKLMNTKLRYRDLHVGDRNAIMLWLRSTGYGSEYNITLSDPNDPEYAEFQATVDLDKLPMKPLGAKPDENGQFDFVLPIGGDTIKFRLLTVGDVEDIELHLEEMDEQLVDISSYTLKKQIVAFIKKGEEIVTDVNEVNKYAERIRLGDVRHFRQYIEKIESGMDMNLTIGTPGGGSVKTFLPLNTSFFWPDL